jgi:hypothetical protein
VGLSGGSGDAYSSLLPAGNYAHTGQQIRLAGSSSPTQIDCEISGVQLGRDAQPAAALLAAAQTDEILARRLTV